MCCVCVYIICVFMWSMCWFTAAYLISCEEAKMLYPLLPEMSMNVDMDDSGPLEPFTVNCVFQGNDVEQLAIQSNCELINWNGSKIFTSILVRWIESSSWLSFHQSSIILTLYQSSSITNLYRSFIFNSPS